MVSADRSVPHFTLDAIQAGPGFAFHLDLIPRMDLGAHLLYVKAAFFPLSTEFDAVHGIEGLSPAHLIASTVRPDVTVDVGVSS